MYNDDNEVCLSCWVPEVVNSILEVEGVVVGKTKAWDATVAKRPARAENDVESHIVVKYVRYRKGLL